MPTIASSPEARRRLLFARTALCGALATLNSFLATEALALPVGGLPEVSGGGGSPMITTSIDRMDVKLNAPRTVLSWTTFNVLPTETVSFKFDNNSWVVLNKVVGLTPSKIEGVVEGRVGANYGGSIWFSSQNSIIFGKGAQIDAGSLTRRGSSTARTTCSRSTAATRCRTRGSWCCRTPS
jgi:filamentous hemagglutinin family protein